MEEIEHTMPIEQLLEKLNVPKVTFGISDHILMTRLAEDGFNLRAKKKLQASFLVLLHENLGFILYCSIMTSLLVCMTEKGPSNSLSNLAVIMFTFAAHIISIFTTEKLKIPDWGTLIAVIRNGKSNIVDSKYLVRGDIVELEQSMIVPADIRLIKATNLLVNGSILLGKEGIRMGDAVGGGEYLLSTNMVFQGFSIETGKAIGVVLQTGPRTILSINTNRVSNLSDFEFKWVFFLAFFWASGLVWQKYFQKEIVYQGFLALCLVLTKLPHFLVKGKGLGILTTSHLLISHKVFPKTILSHEVLSKIKYLVYDIRDVLLTTRKEVKKVYVNDEMAEVQQLKKASDYTNLLDLTYFAVYKEKVLEVEEKDMALEDFDPTPKVEEYSHPIESILREFITGYNIGDTEHAIHLKVPLSGKNRNSLTVVTPKNKDPLAILVGEASEILKSSKKMWVNGVQKNLPVRALQSLCEELTLEGHICIGVAYSEISHELIKEKKDLTPDIFEFSLSGIFIIKEYSEDASQVLPLAKDLGITTIGIGRESKDYLLNLAYMANLVSSPPEEYKGQKSAPWENVIFTPSQAVKNYKTMENLSSFIPNLSIFDTAYLLNQMKNDLVCYVGQNNIALQVSDVGVSMKANSQEIKSVSNFVLLSDTPLVDLLKAIKALRDFGNYDSFFIEESVGCLIPSIAYLVVSYLLNASASSFGILLVDFAIPLSLQFLWIGFPKNSYDYPLQVWVLISLSGFYNYFYVFSLGGNSMACNFAYFFTVFSTCLLKVVWLHIWNFYKERVVWTYTYLLLGIKLCLFWFFSWITMIAERNELEIVGYSEILPGILFYFIVLLSLKVYNPK